MFIIFRMSDSNQSSTPVTPLSDPLSLRKAVTNIPLVKPQQVAAPPVPKPATTSESQQAATSDKATRKISRPSNEQKLIADLRLNNASMHRQIGLMISNFNQISNMLITKTMRIRATVRLSSDIYRQLHLYNQVKTLMNGDKATIEEIQATLTPLINLWSVATTEEDFMPYKTNSITENPKLPRARPLFSLANILKYLAPKENSYSIKPELQHLVHQYCTQVHADCQSFPHLRIHHSYPTVWQSYLAISATVLVFNMNKSKPVRYFAPFVTPASVIDYDNKELYIAAVQKNHKDLDMDSPPPPIRSSEEYIINPKKKKKTHHPSAEPAGNRRF